MTTINGIIVQYFKRIIAVLHRDIKLKNERLKKLEDLTRSRESENKAQSWKTQAEIYKADLRRAEATIADLKKKLGIGPQTAFNIDVVYPGISRKDCDATATENIDLTEALENVVRFEDHTTVNSERNQLVAAQFLAEDLLQDNHKYKNQLRSNANYEAPDLNEAPVNRIYGLCLMADGGAVASNSIDRPQTNQSSGPGTTSSVLIECRYCLESFPREFIDDHLKKCERESSKNDH